ncbi:wax ester/triacylglycerol synthase family O-acyltransferase [Nocardioides taihuensis]|uniref:Diacylglycerol O-acyltransferase n=1 Tax=Nocardioides taihuensis TaxID=1835606 RepID=A0ABW0BDP4_9ACTN
MSIQLMAPLDAVLMTAELLGNPMHVAVLLVLTPPPGAEPSYVDRLYDDAVASGVEVDPRLLRHPHRGFDTGGLWAWRPAEGLELTRHVRRHTLQTGSREELYELVGHAHETPLPQDRPMWEAILVDGLSDGRFAFYIKVHHALMDGVSGLRLVEGSMSTDPDERGSPPYVGFRTHGTNAATPGGRRLPVRMAGVTVRTATAATAMGRRVVEGTIADIAKGLTTDTTVLPFRAPRTRLNGPLTATRSFTAGTWQRERIRRVQEAAPGVTGNDVMTAMLAGGLRGWLAEHDELPEKSLVAICPVSVRTPEGGEAGNAFGTALCNLGTALEDPRQRLDLISRSMAVAKRRVLDLGPVPSLLVAAPSILPTILLPMLPFDPGLRPGYNLPISNVPGPRHDLYWNGAHLDEMYPVSVVYDGMALNVTGCGYADKICLGYVAGRDAVPDVESLVPHTEEALVELETALGVR